MGLRDATAKEITYALMAKRGMYNPVGLSEKAKELYRLYSIEALSGALKARRNRKVRMTSRGRMVPLEYVDIIADLITEDPDILSID